jgi:hypothetical protein
VCGEVGLASVELAPFVSAHNLAGVSDRGGLVEALAECVAHEGAGRGVVAANARVNIPEELAPLGMGTHRCKMPEAARLYTSPSTRVKDLAILAMRLASDRSEGSSPWSIQAMYLSRQSASLGAGSTSMTSASLASYPSRRESTYASFEGSSSMGSAPAGFVGAPEGSAWFEGCGSRVTDG